VASCSSAVFNANRTPSFEQSSIIQTLRKVAANFAAASAGRGQSRPLPCWSLEAFDSEHEQNSASAARRHAIGIVDQTVEQASLGRSSANQTH
jgi:hypothetical protein